MGDTIKAEAYSVLHTLMGGNLKAMEKWLSSYNHFLKNIPNELLESTEGQEDVLGYLIKIRGY